MLQIARALSLVLAASLSWLAPSVAHAQIATDGSLGVPAHDFDGPNFEVGSDYGKLSNSILHFSFEEFGVPEGGSVDFTTTLPSGSIDTVVSRVTGGAPSEILGAFRSSIGESDFFFLNPWGIFFGENSSVDVGGSLHLTTADELRDADGNVFSARNPTEELIQVEPEAFGFLTDDPMDIRVSGEIEVRQGATIDLVGGDIEIAGGFLWAPEGRIRLASVDSAGSVVGVAGNAGLTVVGAERLGRIDVLDEAVVSVSGLEPIPGAPVPVYTLDALKELGLLRLIVESSLQPGDVIIGRNGNFLAVLRGPAAGEVYVRSDSLLIRDADIRARSFGLGGGLIDLEVDGAVEIERVNSEFEVGLLARSETTMVFSAGGFPGLGIYSPPGTYTFGAAGEGVRIDLRSGSLALRDGARISATSISEGQGGEIFVDVERDILITGRDSDARETPTAIFSNAQGTGDAGSIEVHARELRLEKGGAVIAQTTGDAHAGNIEIEVEELKIFDDSQIDSSTSGQSLPSGSTEVTSGNGGRIDVRASKSIFISGHGEDAAVDFARISTLSQERSEGAAGEIRISTPQLRIEDGGGISVRSQGPGESGNILLDIERLAMKHDVTISARSEGAAEDGPGDAGEIRIGLDDGAYTPDFIELRDGSSITTEAANAAGGKITIDAKGLVHLLESGLATSVATGGESAGNIDVASGQIVLNQSAIRANADEGPGGNITLVSEVLVRSPDSVIDASSNAGVDGQIIRTSPETNVEKDLQVLRADFLDASAELRPACSVQVAAGASGSFTVTRSRGMRAEPDGLLLAFDDPSAGSETADGRDDDAVADRVDSLRGVGAARQAEGRYAASLPSLESALLLAQQSGDRAREAAVLGSLGNARLALGDPSRAGENLTRAVALARESGDESATAALLSNFGNLRFAERDYPAALAAYQESATLARSAARPVAESRALSSGARAALEAGEPRRAGEFLARAEDVLEGLPRTEQKATLQIHVAASRTRMATQVPNERSASLLAAFAALDDAADIAGEIADPLLLSYAYGNLAALYDGEHRVDEALHLARRAIRAAEQADAPESLYRWHWLEGRLLWDQGNASEAVAAYRRAVALLEELRSETRAQYGSAESRFHRAVAPVYRDLVDALLQGAGMLAASAGGEALLVEARATMEQLKAAELRDYYRDDCVAEIESKERGIESVAPRTAVVYPILLADRLELLVSLPAGIERHTVLASAAEVERVSAEFSRGLRRRIGTEYRAPAEQLYDWLVRPYRSELEAQEVETLVFVPDGILRTIPMAALHDGKRFLVRDFALAVTPGLSLVDPKPLDAGRATFLLAGLSAATQGFDAIPNAAREIEAIRALYGGDVLLDDAFRADRFEGELASEEPSVVHIASHAAFTGDPATSFILTHDSKLTMGGIAKAVAPTKHRRQPLELLALSACETAVGNERAALGLAGVAIRAGARSALGSLWRIQDAAAYELVVAFYEELQASEVSKAEALRRAQLRLIANPAFRHPHDWSPYLIISNWL